MIREVDHVCVKAIDIDAAVRFYAFVLGGRVTRDTLGPDGKTRFVCICCRGGVVELTSADEPSAQGYAHLAFWWMRALWTRRTAVLPWPAMNLPSSRGQPLPGRAGWRFSGMPPASCMS